MAWMPERTKVVFSFFKEWPDSTLVRCFSLTAFSYGLSNSRGAWPGWRVSRVGAGGWISDPIENS